MPRADRPLADVSHRARLRAALDCSDVSRETLERLEVFADLLVHWNRRINLIARGTAAALWERHILDSAQLVPLVPPGARRGIDIGSGAGFPGLVVALLADIPFDLVEADQRKAAFLREAARVTVAPVTVHAVPAAETRLVPAPVVTARACAPLPRLLALAAPLLAAGGVALFPKGTGVENELTATRREWHMRVERILSRTAPGALILRLSEIQRVGAPA